ncbi:MAG: hypothetical protein GJ677_13630 [Rhodobacteraceae bacterium]|nr:hypothetical protein [Paracoccaceae bacterium]
MKSDKITLGYDGGDTDHGIDPRVLANAILGFTQLANKAIALEFGEQAPFELRVKEVKPGSVNPEFIFHAIEAIEHTDELVGAFLSLSDLIKQAVHLTKHLSGHSPEKREPDGQGSVRVTNRDGNVQVFNVNAEHLTLNVGGASDAEKFVRSPLVQAAEGFSFTPSRGKGFSLDRKESSTVLPVKSGAEILENTYAAWLTIVRPVLQGTGKWTFSDGNRKISADILDSEFVDRVQNGGESFAGGDSLLVEIRAVQEKLGGKLSAKFEILNVIEHEKAEKNGELSV